MTTAPDRRANGARAAGPPALDVRGLRAGWGGLPVVEDVNMRVGAGEIVGLLGRNGAGKSTTLFGIAGFLSHCEGEVRVDGARLRGPAYRRMRGPLGIVLEGRSVFPTLTVAQNLTAAGVGAGDALALFPELEAKLPLPAGKLSGGEQQMLALARAVARRPRALLIDELSFGLSPVACDALFARLRAIVGQTEMAVLLVEQHLHYAAQLVDRALVMNDGRIRLELAGHELLARSEEIEQHYLGGPSAVAAEQS